MWPGVDGKGRAGVLACVPLAFLALGGAGATGARTASDGLIVFVREPDVANALDILLVTAGGQLRNVTRAGGDDTLPLLSPDGKRIAFVHWAGPAREPFLRVIDTDGTNLREVAAISAPQDSHTPNYAWAPDSSRIALTRRVAGRDHISLFDLGTAAVTDVAAGTHPSWSPDGRRVARFSDGLVVRDLVTTAETRLTGDPLGSPESAWSPDGGRILFDRSVLELSTGAAAPLPAGTVWGRSAWSPDGRGVVLGRSSDLLVYDVSTRAVRTLVDANWGTSRRLPAPAWSHDGRSVAVLDFDGDSARFQLALWPAAGGSKQVVPLAPNAVDRFTGLFGWTGDDRGLVVAGRQDADSDPELFVMREDGTGVRRLTANRAGDRRPVWSPTGREIAFVRTGLLHRMRADGTAVRRVSRARVDAAAWSPNGRSFAAIAQTSQGEPRLSMIDAATGRARVLWTGSTDCFMQAYTFAGVAWSPNGRTIAVVGLDDASCNYVIRLVRADGRGRPAVVPGGHARNSFAPTWLRSGHLAFVAYTGQQQLDAELRLAGADGSRQTVVGRDSRQLCAADRISWAPEGDRLVWSTHACGEHYPTLRRLAVATGVQQTIGFGMEADWRPRAADR